MAPERRYLRYAQGALPCSFSALLDKGDVMYCCRFLAVMAVLAMFASCGDDEATAPPVDPARR